MILFDFYIRFIDFKFNVLGRKINVKKNYETDRIENYFSVYIS
jgi:hypothetical protein